MARLRWIEDRHYAYADPDSRRILFWRCRAVLASDRSRKTFWYVTADPGAPGRYVAGTRQHPGSVANRCLYRLEGLRRAVTPRSGGGVVLLTEGEKDANFGARLAGVRASASHHGGACRFTPQQAAHLAPLATRRGRRDGPAVLVVVDRDDPGYADGLHRAELLREIGVRVAVVRPADGVVAGGSVCLGACYCETPCPPPHRGWEKADLTDHVDAGRSLRELIEVPEPELRAGAERWAVRQQHGAVYGVAPDAPPPLTPEQHALVRGSPWLRAGIAPWQKHSGAIRRR